MTSNEREEAKEKPPMDPAATGFGGTAPQHPAVQQQLPQATAASGGIPQPPMMQLVNTINGPMLVPVSQYPHATQPTPPPVKSHYHRKRYAFDNQYKFTSPFFDHSFFLLKIQMLPTLVTRIDNLWLLLATLPYSTHYKLQK